MPSTHHLVDRALIAMHGRHHAFEHRVEELPGLGLGQMTQDTFGKRYLHTFLAFLNN